VIDLEEVRIARQRIPSLCHDQSFTLMADVGLSGA
jgi:hypothetical protein